MNRYDPLTSPSLILKVRDANDSDSWETFERVYAPVIRIYCRRRGIQEADVDDLVQDVMASVSNAIRNFDYDPSRGKFRSWFGTITANRVKTFFAKSTNKANGGPFFPDSSVLQKLSDRKADSEWNEVFCQEVLRSACERVCPNFEKSTWLSFEMTWLNNQPAAEVALILGLPIHTVYVNKSRVLKQLEAEVRALADDFLLPDIHTNGDS